jgi:hypothetical protein
MGRWRAMRLLEKIAMGRVAIAHAGPRRVNIYETDRWPSRRRSSPVDRATLTAALLKARDRMPTGLRARQAVSLRLRQFEYNERKPRTGL